MPEKTDERAEVIEKGRADGRRLFNVSESIYVMLIAANWVLAIAGCSIGVILFLSAINRYSNMMLAAGLVVWFLTAIACAANYAIAVLATHVAKVLVHILSSNLLALEGE